MKLWGISMGAFKCCYIALKVGLNANYDDMGNNRSK